MKSVHWNIEEHPSINLINVVIGRYEYFIDIEYDKGEWIAFGTEIVYDTEHIR